MTPALLHQLAIGKPLHEVIIPERYRDAHIFAQIGRDITAGVDGEIVFADERRRRHVGRRDECIADADSGARQIAGIVPDGDG